MKGTKIIESSRIQGLLEIKLGAHYDFRGVNFEGYNEELYASLHPFFKSVKFYHDSFSRSKKNVLRGFHGDAKNHKLIQPLFGRIQFVVLDLRPDSPTKNHAVDYILESNIPTQIMVPAGCVNAHLCLSDECVFAYKLSVGYTPQENQMSVKWDRYFFKWATRYPILSERDS